MTSREGPDAKATGPAGKTAVDWVATAIVVVVYLGYMLLIALAPDAMAAPMRDGGTVSIGLALGVAVAFGTVVLAIVYTRYRNASETDTARHGEGA